MTAVGIPQGRAAAGPGTRWGWVTGRFVALHHDFGVRAADPTLGRYLEHVFSAMARPGEPATWYTFEQETSPERGTSYRVSYEGEELLTTARPSEALGMLLWHVNQETVRRSAGSFTLLHASAAERCGTAAVFPAPMESGKTTLVAGLVRAGLRYLTDEAAAIDSSGLVVPYPKALSVDPGSWEVLADLRPPVPDLVGPFIRAQWQVVPDDIRPGAVASPSPVHLVVCPRYVAGAATTLEPLHRADALRLLVDSTFLFAADGRRHFDLLAQVARGSACYRLTVGDLERACALVLRLFDDLDPTEDPPHGP